MKKKADACFENDQKVDKKVIRDIKIETDPYEACGGGDISIKSERNSEEQEPADFPEYVEVESECRSDLHNDFSEGVSENGIYVKRENIDCYSIKDFSETFKGDNADNIKPRHIEGDRVNEIEGKQQGINSDVGDTKMYLQEFQRDPTDRSGQNIAEINLPDVSEEPGAPMTKNEISCDMCLKTFTQKASLLVHSRIHTGERPFQCKLYDKSFSQSSSLKNHIRTHTGETPYECTFCTKKFSQSASLKIHIRIHTGETPYKCEFCQKGFSQKASLIVHTRTHTGETPYKCSYCSRSFAQSALVIEHERIHTGEKPFECAECPRTFRRKCHLVDHQRTHSGERPHQCKYCSMRFSLKRTCFEHEKTHTGEKPFQCELCQRTFAQQKYLKEHLLTHSDDSPYQCKLCSKKFLYKRTLKRHENKHAKLGRQCKVEVNSDESDSLGMEEDMSEKS